MSEIKNTEGNPIPETSNPRPFMQPEIWPPHYPSLVYLQRQEGSLTHPVLPTAPNYPITPIFEHGPYPQWSMTRATPEYYSQSIPRRTYYEVGNQMPISDWKAPITSVDHIAVIPAIEEPIANQSTVVSSEMQDKKEKWTGKYCSRICWIVGAFLILIIISMGVFHVFL